MASAEASYLYVIADDAGAHKVGISVSPISRLRALQAKSARRLRIVRTTEAPSPDAAAIEAYAHWLLREACIRGEWFSVTGEAAWVAIVAASEAVKRGERVPRYHRISGPGRPPLSRDSRSSPTMVRLSADHHARIKAIAGSYGMAQWIRDAIDAKLARDEATRPKPDQP